MGFKVSVLGQGLGLQGLGTLGIKAWGFECRISGFGFTRIPQGACRGCVECNIIYTRKLIA